MAAVNLLRGTAAARCRARFGAVPKSSALQLLPSTATGEQWRAARRERLGASELPTVLGVPGAYGSPFQLWWAKRSGWDVEGTEEMSMGLRLEPVIGEVWAERNPEAMLFRPGAALFGHPTLPWVCCTPDYLAVRRGVVEHGPVVRGEVIAEPVECKAYEGGKGWGEKGTDQVPPHIAVQVRVQCAILGARQGHVVRMQGKRITTYTVPAQPLTVAELGQGEAFVRSLSTGEPPALDSLRATEEALTRIYADLDEDAVADVPLSVAVEYTLALRGARVAEARKQEAVNRLRAAMGVAATARADGLEIATRRVGKRAGYTVPSQTIDAIYPKTRNLEGLDV
jgi:predicted phage-related endonuclease